MSNATLRNVDVSSSKWGVWCDVDTVIIGSRISNNTANMYGPYTNGGGDIIP